MVRFRVLLRLNRSPKRLWGGREVVSSRCFSNHIVYTNPHDAAIKSAMDRVILLFVLLDGTQADWDFQVPGGQTNDSLSVYAKGCQVTEGAHGAGSGDRRGPRQSCS